MGGGAGLSMNAAFKIVTENTTFAMPEASIGSVPDVGASYFLSRLPGYFGNFLLSYIYTFGSLSSFFLVREISLNVLLKYLGEYVALTGVRLNGLEMVDCGLATHFVPSNVISQSKGFYYLENMIKVIILYYSNEINFTKFF